MKFNIIGTLLTIISSSVLATTTKRSSQGYIVTLKPTRGRSGDITQDHLIRVKQLFGVGSTYSKRDNNKIGYLYNSTGLGYSATFTNEVFNQVKLMPEVEAVELDKISRISAVQQDAPWGLARLTSGEGDSLIGNNTYTYDPRGGEGVAVYVIDTGINVHHPEFENRAVLGINLIEGTPNTDDNGHGTHCAGTVGSRSYGVAKRAQLVSVKVMDGTGSGTNSDIIAGIDWAVSDQRGRAGNVINISLGGEYSDALNKAVRSAVSAGFVVAVAGGNENQDACQSSPASEFNAITVGAISEDNSRSGFSNYGPCLDIFAPGSNIISTSNDGFGTQSLSGTSMASPHVAGLAAYYLSQTKNASPSTILAKLRSTALRQQVQDPGPSSPNLLLHLSKE